MQDRRDIRTICLNCFSTLDVRTFVCPTCGHRASDDHTPAQALPMRYLLGGRYLIGAPLGRGGFGVTYKAYDMLTSSRVAIKEFFPKGYAKRLPRSCAIDISDAAGGKVFNYWLTAFIQEAKVLTSIKHMEGIVSIYDFFLTNNTAYIVMEYLDGMSLHRFINGRGGRLHLKETLNIMRPVLDTLLLLHQHGIIHKDISPENIQIVNNRQIKLIDFGAASIYNQNVSKPFFVLKKGYSPIELYSQNGVQGPWTDIYEIGATIYTCLVGSPPPESTTRYRDDKIVLPSALGAVIQPVREKSLMKALSVNYKDRYSNIGAFKQMFYGEFMPPPQVRPATQSYPTTNSQPYPATGGKPAYPPTGDQQYPPTGGRPAYPPTGGSPYPQTGRPAQYPPTGRSPYPQTGRPAQYPPTGSQPYPPTGGRPAQYPPTAGKPNKPPNT